MELSKDKNRISFIALAVFSFLILTLSGALGSSLIRAVMLTGVAATSLFVFLRQDKTERNLTILDWAFVVYGCWIVISGGIHIVALYTLPPFSLVNVLYETREWALKNTVMHILTYLLFPVFFLSARALLRHQSNEGKVFTILPALILPSLLVAGYQIHVDAGALNQPGFARLGQAGGLAVDSNALGMLVYLLFPLGLLSLFKEKNNLLRAGGLLFVAAAALTLSGIGSRSAMAGFVLLFLALPLVILIAHRALSAKKKMVLLIAPVLVLAGILILLVFITSVPARTNDSTLARRINSTLQDYERGGLKEVFKERMFFWRPALALSLESPVSGCGPGGFYRELPNERTRQKSDETLRDNATSQYLQMSSDFGVMGLVFNIFLHLGPVILGFMALKRIDVPSERWIVLAVAITCSIMLLLFVTGPHTMAIDVQWVVCLMLAYLAVAAEHHGMSMVMPNRRLSLVSVVAVTAIFIAGSWNNAFGRNGYNGRFAADWWPMEAGELGGYSSQRWKADGWEVDDNGAGRASVETGYEKERTSNVVHFVGMPATNYNLESGYLLKKNGERLNVWNNTQQFYLKWSMKFSNSFIISINVGTDSGIHHIQYIASNENINFGDRYFLYGVGTDGKNGEWHTYIRDLRKDLYVPSGMSHVTSVNTFLIRGSGFVDDIMLCDTPECKNPTIYEDGENWGIDEDVKVGGLVMQRNFRISTKWKVESGKWEITLSLLAMHPDILDKPVTIKIYHGEKLLDTLKLTSSSWNKWTYPLTPDLITKLQKTGEDVVRLKFVVSRTFRDDKGRDIGLYVRRTGR